MKQAILLTAGDELKLLSGSIDELQYAPALLEKYGPDIKPGTIVVLFTVNIDNPFISTAQRRIAGLHPAGSGHGLERTVRHRGARQG
jgi:hypothetical protein